MTKVRTWAGLDVHAASTVACVVDAASGEMSVRRLSGRTGEVAAFCTQLPGTVRVAYEAGPTGFELARALEAAGVGCLVAAPGKIERPAHDRVKTDRRDAERLVRLLMIGGLHPVRVPSSEEEALRDLVRAREDLRGDLMRSRHRLSKLLLRHDVRYDGTASSWNAAHRAWLSKVDLGDRAAQATLLDYVGAVDALLVRRDTIEKLIGELVPLSPWATPVARLRCLRGIDTLSAVGLCAEIGDFSRFDRPARLMSYLGLVPSENSSGQTRRQGAITKSGSRHARRLLVEAAWHYRRPPRKGTTLERRQADQPAQALAISWKAQQRLHQLWRRLDGERGKRKTVVAIAVARHLAGFCWAIANTDEDA
ncbi:IS110 family transposase [Gaiella sp.]|uniref:IS110 family transposase n=1 Tax=Gaiella sp. TaxID=2663207 RepID=UPI002E32FDF6|nr:IS110 family transposase [Gaiella sp.]HEX5583917.1 IS110 family transposase [Gaiella sp.]